MENLGIIIGIRSILRPLKIVYGNLVYFVAIWYIFPRLGILYQDKSGNPAPQFHRSTSWLWALIFTQSYIRNCLRREREKLSDAAKQGDQMGRIFAHWEIADFGQK
jgi:hypothetical protein